MLQNLLFKISALSFVLLMGLCQLSAATITVTSTGDNGAGTLRNAVASAMPGDVIEFSAVINGTPIALTSGEIGILNPITINGNGIANTVITGTNSNRIFNISCVGAVTITDMAMEQGFHPSTGGAMQIKFADVVLQRVLITNSNSESGAGIYNEGTNLTILDSEISGNTANGAAATQGGAAVYCFGGMTEIKNTTISNNAATGTSGSGGGIFNGAGSALKLRGTTFNSNTSMRAGGAIESNTGGTGGLLEMFNVTMTNNTTGPAPGNGGGLHITGLGDSYIQGGTVSGNEATAEGGGLWNGTGTMTIQGVAIIGNTASGAGADQGGGGVFNAGGTISIRNATITNNVADGAAGSGGGILNDMGSTLTITASTISNNSAVRAGGGIEDNSGAATEVTLSNVVLSSNTTGAAPGNGGGFHITGPGDATLLGGTVSGNTASSEGGGLWNGSGKMIIDGTTITGNTASGALADQGGGGVFNAGGTVGIRNGALISNNVADGAAGSGGGILNDAGGLLWIKNSTISMNTAMRAGGGIEDNSGASTTISLRDVILDNNTTGAAPGNGGGLHITGPGNALIKNGTVNGNTAAAEGGGLWNGSGTMTVNGTTIDGNTASGAGADQGGGGVFNAGGTIDIIDAMISNNVANGAAGSGGGVLNDVGSTLTVTSSTISSNSAMRAGGGIEDNSGASTTVTLTDVVLSSNTTGAAPGNGGGFHITGPGDAYIFGGMVTGNTAAAEGGGLWNGTGKMVIDATTIDGNTASGAGSDQGGGGVFNAGGTVNIRNGATITNNVADGAAGSGGGILNDVGGMLRINGCSISMNSAVRAGGGIEDNSGAATTISFMDINLDNNTTGSAPGNGGGLHITGPGNSLIRGGTVNGNTATAEGGGLWNGSGTMTIEGTTIDGNTANGAPSDQGGGGVFNAGGTVNIYDAMITNNVADGTAGSGGGVLNDLGGMLLMERTTVSGNTAKRAGGGIEDNSGSATEIFLRDLVLSNNSTGAAPGNGGGLHITGPGDSKVSRCMVTGNTAAAEGGGLWNGTGTMRIGVCTITGNTASGAGADQGGGGVFNAGGTVMVVNQTTISNNIANGAAGSGGGILNDASGTLMVSKTTISGNSAIRAGGGIEDNSGAASLVSLRWVTLDANTTGAAPGNGGGFHITGPGNADIDFSMITNNTASREGGGLWNGSGTMNVTETTIDGNTASGAASHDGGGGIFNNGGTLNVRNSTISNNICDGTSGAGGGLHNFPGSTAKITYSTVSGNTSGNVGGGIFNEGDLAVVATTIANNVAVVSGGGVSQVIPSASVRFSSSILGDNMSLITGHDISAPNGAVVSSGYNLVENDDENTFPAGATDIEGMMPLLAPLANNGGSTLTHALLCGSPAINAGSPSNTKPDQTYAPVFGTQRDMGAFELQMACPTPDPQTGSDVAERTDETAAALAAVQTSIFPNPTTDGNVRLVIPTGLGSDITVQVTDINGRVVFNQNGYEGTMQLDLSQLPKGNYAVQVITPQVVKVQKLIVLTK